MNYGEGELTTIYDRVNFYRDVKNDPGVRFKRDGNNVALIAGDGTIINDKLIAKTEDVFNHDLDTYTPLKKLLNENQQIVFQYLVDECLENDLTYALWQFTDDVYEEPAMSVELSAHVRAWKELSDKERLQVLAAVMEKGLKEVGEDEDR